MRALALLVAWCALLSGCGDRPGGTATTQPTSAPTPGGGATRPSPPESYRFVLTSSCGERGLLGDYEVVVRRDRVTSARSLDAAYPYRPRAGEVPTLADLLRMAESAPDGAVVDLRVDGSGLPTYLGLDPLPAAVDDEECYAVSGLEPLP